MDVSCPACASKYTCDDEKLRGKTARMRCRACDTVWLVSGTEAEDKRAAVVKRGADREQRDLFASQPLEEGSAYQTMRPPPIVGTGARDENSVLFTIEGLVKGGGARVKTPEPAPVSMSKPTPSDDEGVIDLNALASVAPRAMEPVFASDPPPAAFSRDAGSSAAFSAMDAIPPKYKKIGAAVAGALALAASIVGVHAAFKGEEVSPKAAAAAMVAAPPPVVAPAAPKVDPTPAPATASASSSDDDDAKSSTDGKKAKKGKRHAGGKNASAAITWKKGDTEASAPMSKPAPQKHVAAADPCHCKGDFSCILRCEAKGK